MANGHMFYAQVGKALESDIISFNILGDTIVVLNSADAAADLLDKRSAIYADRPSMVFVTDERLVDWGNAVTTCPSGPRHRNYRRMMHKFVSKTAVTVYHPYQEAEIYGFLKRMLVPNANVEDEFRQAAGAIIMRATYGYRVRRFDDPFIMMATATLVNLTRASVPSNYYVNIFPVLKYIPYWFPGAGWKRKALEWRDQKNTMISETFNWTKRCMQKGNAEPSLVRTLLEGIPETGMGVEDAEEHIKEIACTLFTVGFDTVVASFMIFVLAMTLHPEVQLKAQAEIDSVIGSERLPTIADQGSLPYVNAVIQEVLRWQPVAPIGVPRRTVQDDIYRGYFIPKGSTVIGNTWAITRNPDVYPDPETFNPDRFYEKQTPAAPAFGWGRRICPGQHIADTNLFIAISCILSAFQITKARGENGSEITPTTKARVDSLVYSPEPFPFVIKPRSTHHASLVSALVLGA